MRASRYIALLLLLPAFSCFEVDEPVLPHESGDVETGQVGMTSSYKYQLYYDLGTASMVSSNLKSEWDLGFSASDTSAHVILNTGNFMWALHTGKQGLFAQVDTSGMTWAFDDSQLGIRKTAIGAWGNGDGTQMTGTGELILVDRGYDDLGLPRGIVRLVIDKLENDTFYFRFAEFKGSVEYPCKVARDVAGNHACFSFENQGKQVAIEPPRDDWDLHFTQYTTILLTNDGDPYPYLVTGVLMNPNAVEAVMDSTVDFDSLTRPEAEQYILETSQDVIGYGWKWFDFDAGTYLVLPQNIYIIRDTEGYLYKLRFVSFINQFGERGYPGFEFVRF